MSDIPNISPAEARLAELTDAIRKEYPDTVTVLVIQAHPIEGIDEDTIDASLFCGEGNEQASLMAIATFLQQTASRN